MKERQVTYFEALYHGGIEQHYTKDTKDTDAEIIKAWELCFMPKGTTCTCAKCPYHKFGALCKVKRGRDTLDLIKRYQAENERLRSNGEWTISKIGDGGKTRTCSNCHISQTVNVYKNKVMFNYCPYCGAKMKGK